MLLSRSYVYGLYQLLCCIDVEGFSANKSLLVGSFA